MKNRLRTIASEHRSAFVAGVVAQAVQNYVGLAAVVFFQRTIDSLHGGDGMFRSAVLAYIGFTAANHVLIYVQGYPQAVFRAGSYLSAKRFALKKLSTIDFRRFTSISSGAAMQMVEEGARAASSIYSDFWHFVLTTSLALPGLLFVIQAYDGTLFLVVLVGYLVLFGVAQLLMKASEEAMKRVVVRKEQVSQRISDVLRNLVNFRVQRKMPTVIAEARHLSGQATRSEGRIRLVNELFFTGFAFLVFGAEIFVIVRHVSLVVTGESTVGTLVALVMFVRIAFGPVSGFSFAFVKYKMNLVPWERLSEFLNEPDDPGLLRETNPDLDPEKDIVFRSVDFSYDDQRVVRSLNLAIQHGKRTAIVGASGGGKTTIVRLLLGLTKPSSGHIRVGGVDVGDLSLNDFYQSVALVSQDAPLIGGTLRESIGVSGEVPESELRRTLQDVGLSHLVERLDDEIGEQGVSLSAGERQRVAMVRVMLSEASIVVLDEPTSALDSLSESAVVEALLSRTVGRTVVLITHRLQPTRQCDHIVVLKDGTIAEQGSFEELSLASGEFSQLWREQTRR